MQYLEREDIILLVVEHVDLDLFFKLASETLKEWIIE